MRRASDWRLRRNSLSTAFISRRQEASRSRGSEKKLAKCESAGRSAPSCKMKWKPVVSMPVKALAEPPCFCKKALNAPSSG